MTRPALNGTGPPQPGLPTVGDGEGDEEAGDDGADEGADSGDEGLLRPNWCIPTATPDTAAAAADPSRTRRVMVVLPRWAGVT
jgi:hypothetical protein